MASTSGTRNVEPDSERKPLNNSPITDTNEDTVGNINALGQSKREVQATTITGFEVLPIQQRRSQSLAGISQLGFSNRANQLANAYN